MRENNAGRVVRLFLFKPILPTKTCAHAKCYLNIEILRMICDIMKSNACGIVSKVPVWAQVCFPPCLQIAEAKAIDQCFSENGSLIYTGVAIKPAGYNSKRCQILHRLGMGRSCRGIKIQILLPSQVKSSQVKSVALCMHYVSWLSNRRNPAKCALRRYGTGSSRIVCTRLTNVVWELRGIDCNCEKSSKILLKVKVSPPRVVNEERATVNTQPQLALTKPALPANDVRHFAGSKCTDLCIKKVLFC